MNNAAGAGQGMLQVPPPPAAEAPAFTSMSGGVGGGGGGAGPSWGTSSSGSRAGESRPKERLERGKPREPHDPKRKFTGTITRWDDDSGFGFISSWEAYKVYGKDIFVHKAQVGTIGGASSMYAKRKRSEIRNGDTVTYTVDLAENPGKPRAYNVEKIAAAGDGTQTGEEMVLKTRRMNAGLGR